MEQSPGRPASMVGTVWLNGGADEIIIQEGEAT